GLPTGVRTGEFLALDGSVLANPILPDDFFSAKWALEFSGPPGKKGKNDKFCSESGEKCKKDKDCPKGEKCESPPTGGGPAGGAACLMSPAGLIPSGGDFRWRWHDVSRLAAVKNLLGNSITLETLATPMTASDVPTPWIPSVEPAPAPLPLTQREPISLVDNNVDKINFGFGVFSCLNCHNHNLGNYSNEMDGKDPKPSCKLTNNDFDDGCYTLSAGADPDAPDGNKPAYKTLVPINTNDLDFAGQNFVRDAIDAYLKPSHTTTALTEPDGTPVTIQGLQSYTATPTPCAINCARLEFKNRVFPSDPKLTTCQRRNYVILITDGQSTVVDGGHNIKDCGGLMPWETADTLFTDTRNLVIPDNPEGAVRTFVIGLSTQTVSGTARTELNRIAFAGRTDASEPSGGVEIAGDDPVWNNFDPIRNYAYFAKNAQELTIALQEVILSITAVDLATAPPVTSGNESLAAFNGAFLGLLASADFPESLGHLRLFNLDKVDGDPDFEIWDAGDQLSTRDLSFRPRKIYTSDPSYALVPLVPGDSDSITTLRSMLGALVSSDEEASAVLNFLHGLPVPEVPGDPSSPTHTRPWRLGDIINSSPAIRGAPPNYGHFADHQSFQNIQRHRHPLVFIGSNDLLLHAFDLVDGDEVWAYLPPNLLPKLVQQHSQWVSDGYRFMGQPFGSLDHIYGVALSPRLVDIKDDSGDWITALFSGEGPGGHAVFGLDVTSSYPGRDIDGVSYPEDQDFDPTAPFRVLWFKTNQDVGLSDLGETWSVPAAGFGKNTSNEGTWLVAFGSAYGSGDEGRFLHVLDAFSGDLVSKKGVTALQDRAGQLVTDNFYFADTVGYSSVSISDDAPLTVEVQSDLAGRLWTTEVNESAHTHNLLYDVGADQPLYFAPSVSTFRAHGPYTVAAYASGAFDETDTNVNGASSTLAAKLFISASTLDGISSATTTIEVTSLTKPDGTVFSSATRPVSSPLTVITKAGTARSLFTLFDPTPVGGDCFGRSFIVAVDYVPDPLSGPHVSATAVFTVGSGKVSGFAVGKRDVVVGKSGTGGESATIAQVVDTNIVPPGAVLSVLHWKEVF
ncbi:MAG: PilC/PilY family type IV pilus protein, partial [Actinobacteria bacterium]|nr:PilC/PilY family type IV pilus protein [Actinomycetota bacterium]